MMEEVLVVGASSKVGNAIVSAFLEEGAFVYGLFNATAPRELGEGSPLWHKCDITDGASVGSLLRLLDERQALLSSAVFAAGFLPGLPLEKYTPELLDLVIRVNFTAQVALFKGIAPFLRKEASVIFLSSISGQRGSFDPIYAAAKGAILAFVKAAAAHTRNFRINAIAPGLINESGMFQQMSPEVRERHRASTPSHRFLEPGELADIVVSLAKPYWKHLHGACIDLNGGSYLR